MERAAGSPSAYNKHIAMWEGQTGERSKTDTGGKDEGESKGTHHSNGRHPVGKQQMGKQKQDTCLDCSGKEGRAGAGAVLPVRHSTPGSI